MWGLVMGLYFIGFFQRMAPAVMAEDLMRDFNLGGALLGNLSAMYFYSYAIMQIPSGLLVDRIGSRRLAGGACAVAACGIIIFSLGTSIWFAYAGRLLIGASVAVAWVTCMKLAGHWFPPNRFATVTGVGLVVGNLGGVLAGVPLSEAVSLFGWRMSMGASGVLTFAVALVIWLAVRDDPQEYGYRSYAHSSVLKNGNLPAGVALRSVMLNRQTWLLFFAGGLTAAPVLTFAGSLGSSLSHPGTPARSHHRSYDHLDDADRLGGRRAGIGRHIRSARSPQAAVSGQFVFRGVVLGGLSVC